MPRIIWEAGLFSGTSREESEEVILKLLAVLVDQDCKYLRRHPELPRLYDSGVEYALPEQMTKNPDPEKLERVVTYLKEAMGVDEETIEIVLSVLGGCEVFRDVEAILKKKRVDCDNLAAYRSAELRLGGVEAVPYIVWRETPKGTTYHALVRWPDGTSEDPSLILGMGGESKAKERAEERRKNKERYDKLVLTAHTLCMAGHTNPKDAGKRIDALGLLPKGGSW